MPSWYSAVGRVGVDVGAERDDAAERPVLDLDLLVEPALGPRRQAPADEQQLAPADLDLDLVGVDAGELGVDDRPRRVVDVEDVDRGENAARRRCGSKTSPNSSSTSRRIRSKFAKRSREDMRLEA